ncbi:MAG: hypothetical protein QOI53_3808 [Verrucomicrobiota bacterium]|nr:hypothetical protein [Verrucomicrobiota bacterium]
MNWRVSRAGESRARFPENQCYATGTAPSFGSSEIVSTAMSQPPVTAPALSPEAGAVSFSAAPIGHSSNQTH